MCLTFQKTQEISQLYDEQFKIIIFLIALTFKTVLGNGAMHIDGRSG